MRSVTILCPQTTKSDFLQHMVQTGSAKDFHVKTALQTSMESSMLIEAIHAQANQNPNGVLVLVSGGQYEIAQEVHETLTVLPIQYFPAFPAVLARNNQNPAAAFTQVHAGRISSLLMVVIPEQQDLIRPLFEILQRTGVLFNNGLSPTVINEVGAVPDETIVVPAKPVEIKTSHKKSSQQEQISAPPSHTKSAWKSAITNLHLKLGSEHADLPEELLSIPAAHAVLEQAGERRYASDHYGNKFPVFGFPDLKSPRSKVLIVRPGAPYPEIIVLHRHPFKVGLIPNHHSNYLISSQQSVEDISLKITKRENRGERVVAIESNVVYIQRDKDIIRWDGRRESDMGTINQAIASLILQWSQR